MKHLSTSIYTISAAFCLLLLVASCQKKEPAQTAPSLSKETAPAGTTAEQGPAAGAGIQAASAPAQSQGSATLVPSGNGSSAAMPAKLVGKWQAPAEKGIVYDFRNGQVYRYKGTTLSEAAKVTFSKDYVITCGGMDKRFRNSQYEGFLVLEGQKTTCYMVFSITESQMNLVKLDPGAQPESWLKMN